MKFKKHIRIAQVLLILAVFTAGVLLGRSLNQSQSELFDNFIKENELDTESYLIEQELIEQFGQDSCDISDVRIKDLTEELGNIGIRLSSEDAKSILGDEQYRYLKRKFHLLQIKTYSLFKRFTEKCKSSSKVILYYYGLNDQNSSKQGEILDEIVKDYDAKIFAIEFQYSPELSFLESYYDIIATPSIVIHFNQTYRRLASYEEIAQEISS